MRWALLSGHNQFTPGLLRGSGHSHDDSAHLTLPSPHLSPDVEKPFNSSPLFLVLRLRSIRGFLFGVPSETQRVGGEPRKDW